MMEISTGARPRGAGTDGATIMLARRRLGDVLLFATVHGGRPDGEVPSPAGRERRYTVLVHVGDQGGARSRIVCADQADAALRGLRGELRAIAVPDRMLPPHSALPYAVPLADTALVRASRALTGMLFAPDVDASSSEATAASEEVVVAMVRGILREQRLAMINATEGDEVEHRVWALIAERHPDPSFDVDVIARELAFSRRQLYRHVSGEVGIAQLIAQHRLSTAMRLIGENPATPLVEIARASGFSRLATMRAFFTAQLGVTPTGYRQSVLAART